MLEWVSNEEVKLSNMMLRRGAGRLAWEYVYKQACMLPRDDGMKDAGGRELP